MRQLPHDQSRRASGTDGVATATSSAGDGTGTRNLLLASLPAEDLQRVRPHLETMYLEQRTRLFEPGRPFRDVYFPETAVVSLINALADDVSVEVGTAGCEGMAGLALFLADGISPVIAVVQVPGVVSRMSAETFTMLTRMPGAFHDVMLRYAAAFLGQVAQTAACNARHLVDQRCARWLLMTHDRVQGDHLPLTHEFLAFMLGVRRAGVSVAMHELQQAGVITYNRGAVQVLDRARLESISCECYQAVREYFSRLLPRPAIPAAAS